MFFADALLTNTPKNMSVTIGDRVTFTCTAVSFLYQPVLHWILDNETYTDCLIEAAHCINNDFLNEQLTESIFTFTALNIRNHSVTCVVHQRAEVNSTATLTVLPKGDTLYV